MTSMKCRELCWLGLTLVALANVAAFAAEDGSAVPDSNAVPVTFNKHIAPLLFQNCVTCHRPGEVAPFSLLSYADAKKRAQQLQTVTADRFMPPWKSVAGHGSFLGER